MSRGAGCRGRSRGPAAGRHKTGGWREGGGGRAGANGSYLVPGWREAEDGAEIGRLGADGDESALAALDPEGEEWTTLRGPWEDVSDSFDAQAGRQISPQEFCSMFVNDSAEPGGRGADAALWRGGFGGGAGRAMVGVGQLRRGSGKQRQDVRDAPIWGVRLGELWETQAWAAGGEFCRTASNASYGGTEQEQMRQAACVAVRRVLAMTGPIVMSQLIPAYEALFPGPPLDHKALGFPKLKDWLFFCAGSSTGSGSRSHGLPGEEEAGGESG